MLTADEILGNVVWLVNAIEDEALEEVQDVFFLELAKVVTTSPLPRDRRPAKAVQLRIRSPYPTTGKKALIDSVRNNAIHRQRRYAS
jgi:hypothetical protein